MRLDTSTYPYSTYFLQSAQFVAAASSYPGVTAARTGGNAAVMRGLSAAAVIAAGSTPLFEDRGDGLTVGVWTFPGFTNDASTDFSTWANVGTPTKALLASATAPDGAGQAYEVLDTHIGTNDGISVAVASGQRVHSVWVRDHASQGPTVPGMAYGGGALGVSLGGGTGWRRVSYIDGTVSTLQIDAAGAQPGPVLTVIATGGVDLWMPSSVAFPFTFASTAGTTDYPAIVGTTGAATLQIVAPDITDGGDLDFEVSVVRMTNSTDQYPASDGYIFSAASPDGLIALRYQNSAGNPNYILTVRGSDVLTMTDAGFLNGNDETLRVWYRVSTGQMGILRTVNGVSTLLTGATTGGVLRSTTAAWLGSNLGASGHSAMLHRSFKARKLADVPITMTPEGVLLGDSISVGYKFALQPGGYIYSAAQRRVRSGMVQLGHSGGTIIADQGDLYDASPYKGQSTLRFVVIEAGINDILVFNQSAATLISAYQTRVNIILAANPSAKVIAQQIGPARGVLSAPQYAVWQAVNQAIAGGGGTPITGVTPVTSHNYGGAHAIGDVNNALLAAFDGGDGLHPNYLGRAQLGLAQREACIAAGAIPS